MSSRWMPVFQGEPSEVLVLQSSCEASGIPTFVPDLNFLYLDISARGGNMFSLQLLVPEDRIDDARSLVPESKRAKIAPLPSKSAELDLMARRVQICALLILTAPLAIWFYVEYRRRLHGSEEVARIAPETNAAFGFAILVCLVAGVWLAGRIAGG